METVWSSEHWYPTTSLHRITTQKTMTNPHH